MLKNHLSKLISIFYRCWGQLAFMFLPKIDQLFSKINLQRHQIPDLPLGALPMPQGVQDSPLALQDGPRTIPRRSQEPPKTAKMRSQNVSKMSLEDNFGRDGRPDPSKLRFWSVLGWILEGFGLEFGRFLASILEGFEVDDSRI